MKIVFEGDSITDCGRNVNNGSRISIGQSYAMLVASKLGAEYPGEYEFVNSAVSGSRVVDLYARIKAECWNHNPDIISILVGVNDVWHEFNGGVETERYKKVYSMYIEDTMAKFPNIKMMLLEPFVLKGRGTTGVGPDEEYSEEKWNTFYTETRAKANVVKELAEKYGQVFVPLQERFEEAEKRYPQPYWIEDGVHPYPAGQQVIADAWLQAFDKYIK